MDHGNGGYLSQGSNKSTMRLVVLMVTIVVCLILIVTSITAFVLAIEKKPVDWMGMSAFIGAITLILGTVITGKVSQKGIEQRKQ